MNQRLFPQVIDNRFEGHRLAIWLLGGLVVVRLLMSFNIILNTRSVAVGADGIPLNSFSELEASRFLSLFAVFGVSQLVLAMLGLLALFRYRAMIPLLYLLFLAEMLARRLILLAQPLAGDGARPIGFYINLGLLVVLLLGLTLSIRRSGAVVENAP